MVKTLRSQGTYGTREADRASGFRTRDCIWFHNQGTCQARPRLEHLAEIKMNHNKRGSYMVISYPIIFYYFINFPIKFCSTSFSSMPSPGGTPRDALPEVGFLPRELSFHPSLHGELRLTHVGTIALELHGAEAHELSEVVPEEMCFRFSIGALCVSIIYAFLCVFLVLFYGFIIIMPFFQSVSLHAMLPIFRRFLPRFKVQSASL